LLVPSPTAWTHFGYAESIKLRARDNVTAKCQHGDTTLASSRLRPAIDRDCCPEVAAATTDCTTNVASIYIDISADIARPIDEGGLDLPCQHDENLHDLIVTRQWWERN
jgi:hypothetical protein